MKKLLILMFVSLLIISAASAFESKDKYVRMIENTDICMESCHTIYEVTAYDRDLTIDPSNLYFQFRTDTDMKKVDTLNKIKRIEQSILTNVTAKDIIGKNIVQEVYKEFKEPIIIRRGESRMIRIDGVKEASANVDNIINIKIPADIMKLELFDRTYSYDEWVWWTTSTTNVLNGYSYFEPFNNLTRWRNSTILSNGNWTIGYLNGNILKNSHPFGGVYALNNTMNITSSINMSLSIRIRTNNAIWLAVTTNSDRGGDWCSITFGSKEQSNLSWSSSSTEWIYHNSSLYLQNNIWYTMKIETNDTYIIAEISDDDGVTYKAKVGGVFDNICKGNIGLSGYNYISYSNYYDNLSVNWSGYTYTLPVNASYNTPVFETSTEPFSLEMNWSGSKAILIYNGTSYNATQVINNTGYSRFNASAIIPLVNANTTGQFYWNYTLTNSTAYELIWTNTSMISQNIAQAYLINLRTDLINNDYVTTQVFNAYYNFTNFSSNAMVSHVFVVNATPLTSSFYSALSDQVQTYKGVITTPAGANNTFNLAGVINVSFNGQSSIRTSNKTITIGPRAVIINIFDESTGVAITQNVSIQFTGVLDSWINYTDVGLLYNTLNTGEYTLSFNSVNYTERSYILTASNLTQTLNAYLPLNSTSTTLFTVTDKDTNALLENALISVFRLIGGSWQLVSSKYTDVTGKLQIDYIPAVKYKFFLSKQGYNDYIFYLDPIIFTEYGVSMSRSTLINYTQDFDKLAIIYSPSHFSNEATTPFSWIIVSPTGLLSDYGYTVTYPGGSDTQAGSNAIGSELTSSIAITGASAYDVVQLDYYYVTTLSGRRNFRVFLPIDFVSNATGNMTFMSNKDKTYGLGIFERMFIATLIVLFVVGIATMVGQILPGFALGMFIFGYMTYVGFIPIWGILPSMFIGAFILVWKGGA